MNESEVRSVLYGAIVQEAESEAEFVARQDPWRGRLWFSSVRQLEQVERGLAMGVKPGTAELVR